jgi:hypothetical protein
MFWLVFLIGLFCPTQQRSLSLTDIQTLVDNLGDEIVTHNKLPSAAQLPEAIVSPVS